MHEVSNKLPDADSQFRYVGPIPKTEVAEFYRELDVIVLPVPGGAMVTSGKVFEAAALGIPIVCVQSAGGGARQILRSHELTVFAEPASDDVEAALAQAATLASERTAVQTAAIRAKMSQFERLACLKPMVDVLTNLVAPSQADVVA